MQFTKIRIVGPTTIDLPKDNLDPTIPYILKDADGLGPPEIDVFMKRTSSGGKYQSRKANLREIVLRVGLQPNWNIGQTSENLRSSIYKQMTPIDDATTKIQLMNGDVIVAQTEGYIKRVEPALFSKDPEVQITIPCLHWLLQATTDIYETPAKVNTGASSVYFDVVNAGDAPSGFWMGFAFTAPFNSTFQLMKDTSSNKIMSISHNFVTGDRLVIDTRDGSRGVWKIPNGSGISTSIMDDVSANSPWLQLHSGNNRFIVNDRDWNWYFLGVLHRNAWWGV